MSSDASRADIDDLALEIRSLRRQVESLQRHLADRTRVDEALPLRKVAPLIGFSVGRLRWYMCDATQREVFDLDSLLFRVGRRWFSTPARVQQWLDARAKRDPRIPAGTTLSELVARGRTR